MTKNELEKELKSIKAARKQLKTSKAAAMEFLQKAGVVTKEGKVSKRHRRTAA